MERHGPRQLSEYLTHGAAESFRCAADSVSSAWQAVLRHERRPVEPAGAGADRGAGERAAGDRQDPARDHGPAGGAGRRQAERALEGAGRLGCDREGRVLDQRRRMDAGPARHPPVGFPRARLRTAAGGGPGERAIAVPVTDEYDNRAAAKVVVPQKNTAQPRDCERGDTRLHLGALGLVA